MAQPALRPETLKRNRPSFLARTPQDNAAQLNRRLSSLTDSPSGLGNEQPAGSGDGDQDTRRSSRTFLRGLFSSSPVAPPQEEPRRSSGSHRRRSLSARPDDKTQDEPIKPKPGLGPRPVGGSDKLGTFAGVFVPTTLNVLSILMFLRFGFILGQSGVLAFMGMLVACYTINVITTMSLSAIATNGTVRGGGAYYLISRSLGPEFGGSIGIVFYLGLVFNTGMNAVGLVDCITNNFGSEDGNWASWLPESYWWNYLWATVVLVSCTVVCLAGSGLFARASNGLLVILLIATLSIPFSALIQRPFEDRRLGIGYTGPSLDTFRGNLYPQLTKGASGSQLKRREDWQDLFGVLFPATGGIFAGASMSGDLKHPSKAIPKGTLYGLALTFFAYTVVIIAMAFTITRATFYRNVNIIQDVNLSGILILLGESATSAFSTLMGVIGAAKLLQALARDNLFPGLSLFSQGTKGHDEPTFAIIITYVLTQLTMLSDINQIASFVTMTYLMTFLVMNLACFLLKISSAPNFRPSFHYFNWFTAFAGTVLSGATMFFVDGNYASGCVLLLALLFLVVHYTAIPKSWGDVSQSLIYHQVRKYLLRLRQEHVKFWRPQILLFINDPRRQYRLIQFCNSLKKGALFILGHVIVTDDFGSAVPEAKKQQQSWTKYIDFSKIKAFVNIAISPSVEWGSRNIVLNAGLGGMRPNIVVMGFFNLDDRRKTDQLIDLESSSSTVPTTPVILPKSDEDPLSGSILSQGSASSKTAAKSPRQRRKGRVNKPPGELPTDANRPEHPVTPASYVTVLEDLLLRLQANVALAKGFQDIELPPPKPTRMESIWQMFTYEDAEASEKRCIDLWPIQMTAEIEAGGRESQEGKSVLTTNFDTYTLILQLGCILNTVPSWKRSHRLRVAVFVEYEADVEEERGRVKTLLSNLRIQADVLVFWLACGDLKTYEVIVNGKSGPEYEAVEKEVARELAGEEWWDELQTLLNKGGGAPEASGMRDMAEVAGLLETAANWPGSSFQHGRQPGRVKRFKGLRKMLRRNSRRASMSGISELGISLGMRTSRLDPQLVEDHPATFSASEDSDLSSDSDSEDTFSPGRSTVSSRNFSADESLAASDAEEPRRATVNRVDQSPRGGQRDDSEQRPASPSRSTLAGSQQIAAQDFERRRSPTKPFVIDSQAGASRPDTSAADDSPAPSRVATLKRPTFARQQSGPKFTSKPLPETTVAKEEGAGPSIMFAEHTSPSEARGRSAYQRNSSAPTAPDRGPGDKQRSARRQSRSDSVSVSAIPLSFNDLPCRAQHLILNELMRAVSSPSPSSLTASPALSPGEQTQPAGPSLSPSSAAPLPDMSHYSSMIATALGEAPNAEEHPRRKGGGGGNGTAVLFTTLPSPASGTGASERESLKYLMDLEVLCKGLPPVLLVHSNSISVTMSL